MARILIVDDMQEVYGKISKYFVDADYASTKEEAIEKIKSGKYDRVITDYHLGDNAPQGGLEVARVAKERGLIVILMSRENHVNEARELGIEFKFKRSVIENGCKD